MKFSNHFKLFNSLLVCSSIVLFWVQDRFMFASCIEKLSMSSIRCTSLFISYRNVLASYCIRNQGCRELPFLNCPKGDMNNLEKRNHQILSHGFQHVTSSKEIERKLLRCRVMFLSIRNNNNNKHTDEPSTSLCLTSQKTVAKGLHMTSSELIVKKSRFIGFTSHVSSWSHAQQIIDMVKKQHPKARHWCFGCRYLTCDQEDDNMNNNDHHELLSFTERSSDDGEPSGTGGAPILSAIRTENIQNVVCVVVRYYGGIQLGTGGLIRAYGAAARQVLRESPTVAIIPTVSSHISVPMEYIGSVYDCIHKMNNAISDSENYSTDGNVNLTITCNASDIDKLKRILLDSTRGTIQFREAKSS